MERNVWPASGWTLIATAFGTSIRKAQIHGKQTHARILEAWVDTNIMFVSRG